MSESDADKILSDVEDAARKNPWAVVAGGVALGFAASRFLKASSSDRYERRASTPPSPQPALPRVPEPGEPQPVAEPRFSSPGTGAPV